MNCTTSLEGIDFSSCDNSVGGIDRIMLGLRDNLVYLEDANGRVTSVHGVFYNIDILENSGGSSFTDVLSITSDGSKSVVPTVTAEVLTQSSAVTKAINAFAQPYLNLVALVRLTTGEWVLAGKEFGLTLTASGTSGSQRSEKAGFTLSLVGEENTLSDILEEENVDAYIVAGAADRAMAVTGQEYMARIAELAKSEYINFGSFSATMENLEKALSI